jgi:hypothetical protein
MISREDYKKPKIPCRLDFLWDRVHEARKVEMRGEGTSWRKLIFLFPTRG